MPGAGDMKTIAIFKFPVSIKDDYCSNPVQPVGGKGFRVQLVPSGERIVLQHSP
jgi:hypothetical protein